MLSDQHIFHVRHFHVFQAVLINSTTGHSSLWYPVYLIFDVSNGNGNSAGEAMEEEVAEVPAPLEFLLSLPSSKDGRWYWPRLTSLLQRGTPYKCYSSQSVTTFFLFAFSLLQPVFMLISVQACICAAAALVSVSVDFSNNLLITDNLIDNQWQPVLTAQALFLFHTLSPDHYGLLIPVTQSSDRMAYKRDRSWSSHLGTKNSDRFAENKACSSCSTG